MTDRIKCRRCGADGWDSKPGGICDRCVRARRLRAEKSEKRAASKRILEVIRAAQAAKTTRERRHYWGHAAFLASQTDGWTSGIPVHRPQIRGTEFILELVSVGPRGGEKWRSHYKTRAPGVAR